MQLEPSRPRVLPTLTTLPISILEQILDNLCDEPIFELRSSFQGTTSFLPYRYPPTDYTLDYAESAHATLPARLLAPALASPILATAAASLLGRRFSYLTFLSTEGRLPLYVHAFTRHVKAVCAGVVAEEWHPELPHNVRALRLNKVFASTVHMFKELAINYVRLQVLDLVQVPFHECGAMQDDLMTGLCATLESSHTTLRELALPVYWKSDLCARALETVTLPHLVVFSIQLMNERGAKPVSDRREQRLGRPFLRMMQAVDGHADRSCGVSSLVELRLMNVYKVPCTSVRDSGCSGRLFRAVRTLRVARNDSVLYKFAELLSFFMLFGKLECLYWNGSPYLCAVDFAFKDLCKRLREVHICPPEWMTGVEVGLWHSHRFLLDYTHHVLDIVEMSCKKIVSLAMREELDACGVLRIPECCPNLENLSLHVTPSNLFKLGEIFKKCKRLTSLELTITEDFMERNECRVLLVEVPKTISRYHPNLRDVAIRTEKPFPRRSIPVDAMIDCFVDVVKRVGIRANRLVFEAGTRSRRLVQLIDGVSRILSTCTYHSRDLTCLKIDLIPRLGRKVYDKDALVVARRTLRYNKRVAVCLRRDMEKVDLGYMHFYSN